MPWLPFGSRYRRRGRRSLLLVGSLLTLLLAALAWLAVVSGIANPLLVRVGLAASRAPDPNSFTTPVQINGKLVFPTPTVRAWASQATPRAAAIPSSQTPAPGALPSPTPTDGTPSPGAASTPTAGAPPTTCNGATSSATWAFSTCPLIHGQRVTLTLVDRAHPGASTNILINFGNCAGCTLLLTPSQGYRLDATGREAVTVTIPSSAANSAQPVSGTVNIAGGPTLSLAAPPVR